MSALVERLIAARDRLRSVEAYAGGEGCPVQEAREAMAEAANALSEAETAAWVARNMPTFEADMERELTTQEDAMVDAAWKRHEAAGPK